MVYNKFKVRNFTFKINRNLETTWKFNHAAHLIGISFLEYAGKKMCFGSEIFQMLFFNTTVASRIFYYSDSFCGSDTMPDTRISQFIEGRAGLLPFVYSIRLSISA